jgi:hypothetical protein
MCTCHPITSRASPATLGYWHLEEKYDWSVLRVNCLRTLKACQNIKAILIFFKSNIIQYVPSKHYPHSYNFQANLIWWEVPLTINFLYLNFCGWKYEKNYMQQATSSRKNTLKRGALTGHQITSLFHGSDVTVISLIRNKFSLIFVPCISTLIFASAFMFTLAPFYLILSSFQIFPYLCSMYIYTSLCLSFYVYSGSNPLSYLRSSVPFT